MVITEEIVQKIKDKILTSFKVEKIILFGSYAYGKPEKGSDIDLLIIKEADGPRHKRAIPIRRLFRGDMIPMDILVYTNEELIKYKDIKSSFIYKVLTTGKILYG